MELDSIQKVVADFKSDLMTKLTSWGSTLETREKDLKILKEKLENLQDAEQEWRAKCESLEEEIASYEAQKLDTLEQGINKDLKDLENQRQDMMVAHKEKMKFFPECPVCFEVCDPSQDRLVYCCPEGHTICGQCAHKLSKCPTCNKEKSRFSGAFTRVREFESQYFKTELFEDNLKFIDEMVQLALEKKRLEDVKESVEIDYDDEISPLEEELEEARNMLSTFEIDLQHAKNEYETAEKGLAYFTEGLKKNFSQIGNLTNSIEAYKETVSKLDCSCKLSCPHSLLLDKDEMILGDPCECTKKAPCLCVTHSITMDLAIEEGSSGSIKMHLAGRNAPQAVNAFYSASRHAHFDGLILDQVKGKCYIEGGYFGDDGEENPFVLYDRKDDASGREQLECQPFSVGYWSCSGRRRTSFRIYVNDKSYNRFDTVGVVVEGFDLLNEISSLPTSSRMIGSRDCYSITDQLVKIRKSAGELVMENKYIPSKANSDEANKFSKRSY